MIHCQHTLVAFGRDLPTRGEHTRIVTSSATRGCLAAIPWPARCVAAIERRSASCTSILELGTRSPIHAAAAFPRAGSRAIMTT